MLGPCFWPLTPPDTVASQLWQACAALCEIRWDAINCRKQYLNDLLTVAKATKNKACKKLIWGLKQAEDMHHCFVMVHAILQPTTPGSLTYLKIPPMPDNPAGTMITNIELMEHHLLEHTQHHFWHAHGTPYMVPPLSDLLGFDGLTPFGHNIFHGAPIPDTLPLDPAMRLLFMNQSSLLQPSEKSDHPIEFKSLMKRSPSKRSTSWPTSTNLWYQSHTCRWMVTTTTQRFSNWYGSKQHSKSGRYKMTTYTQGTPSRKTTADFKQQLIRFFIRQDSIHSYRYW